MRTVSANSPGLLQVDWPHAAPGPTAHVVLLLLYTATALLTLVLGLDRPEGWAVWPAASLGAGIGLGAVCRCGIGMLPAVAIAAAGANLLSGIPTVEALGVAGAQAVMIFAAVVLHQGIAGFTLGSAARAWLAMGTGCILMAPLVLMARPHLREHHSRVGPDGYVMILVLVALMTTSQMRGLDPELTTSLSYAVLVAAAIIAMFQSARTVAIAVAVAGLAGAICASLSFGPFDHAADPDQRLLVLIKLCLTAFVALSVSAVRAEHQRLSRQGSERLNRIARSGEARAREDAETRIAGELNQPLTAIRTYAQTAARQLARELPDGDRATLRRALQGIVSGTERAARSVRPRGEGTALPQTEVESFVHQCLGEAGRELASRRIWLRKTIESGLPPVLVSEAELERVVLLALHISIELAVENGTQRSGGLQLDCRLDAGQGLVLIEFRVHADRRRSLAAERSPGRNRDWLGWIERLDRFESEGGYFSLREEGDQHVIRIGLPAALDKQ